VDHPATQQWKRDLLEANGIATPESLTYAPVDFEHQLIATQLADAGLDSSRPTFFAWLGVVPYLTLEAFRSTLALIAAQPAGSGVVMDYGQPREALPLLERMARDSMSSRVAGAGEPFQLFFTPQDMALELRGFHAIEDLGSKELNARYFTDRSDNLRMMGAGGRIVNAWL
jgi:methyltransferase (TIGR00027 family)